MSKQLITLTVNGRPYEVAVEPRWGTMRSRQWDTNCWVADSRLIREKLGWRPRYGLEQGFREMLDWFRSNPSISAFYEKFHPAEPTTSTE